MRQSDSIKRVFHVVSVLAARRGQRGKRNDGEDRALRGKGRRVMRSRLVHEWRGVVDGWYFVPFQTRRKPRRQDFGVRLKSCRLNLRLPNQPSTLHNPSVVFSPRLTPLRTLILLADGRRRRRAVNIAAAVHHHVSRQSSVVFLLSFSLSLA